LPSSSRRKRAASAASETAGRAADAASEIRLNMGVPPALSGRTLRHVVFITGKQKKPTKQNNKAICSEIYFK
jgi:hypothetical protein